MQPHLAAARFTATAAATLLLIQADEAKDGPAEDALQAFVLMSKLSNPEIEVPLIK
jgi:hypothetical protein